MAKIGLGLDTLLLSIGTAMVSWVLRNIFAVPNK